MRIQNKPIRTNAQMPAGKDLNRPVVLAEKFAQLSMMVGQQLDQLDKQEKALEVQGKVNDFNREYTRFTSLLNNSNNYDLNDSNIFDDATRQEIMSKYKIDENNIDDQGRLLIPAYKANPYLHDNFLSNRLPDYEANLDSDDRIRFNKQIAKKTNAQTDLLIKTGFAQRAALRDLDFKTQESEFINSGNAEGLQEFYDMSYRGGVIDELQYKELQAALPSVMTVAEIGNLLNLGEVDQAEKLLATNASVLSLEQKNSLYDRLQKQQKAVTSQLDKELQEQSNESVSGVYKALASGNTIQTYADLEPYLDKMTYEDQASILKYWQAYKNNPANLSDKQVKNTLQRSIMLMEFGVVSEKEIKRLIYQSTNSGFISGEDSLLLMNQADERAKKIVSDPALKAGIDKIWLNLTKGSRAAIEILKNPSDNVIAASKFEEAMIKEYMKNPIAFDVDDFYRKNYKFYETADGKKNQAKFYKNVAASYIVKDKAKDGSLDEIVNVVETQNNLIKLMQDKDFLEAFTPEEQKRVFRIIKEEIDANTPVKPTE